MTAKVKMTFDELHIDPKGIDIDAFKVFAEREMTDTLANLTHKLGRGVNAQGRQLKSYSASYRRWKLKKYGQLNKLEVTGELKESRKPTPIRDGFEMRFHGTRQKITNAQLAGYLHDKGYTHWHEFGRDDIRRITKNFEKMIETAFDKTIRIKKRF